METSIKLTVYFEDPFWVGVLEKTEDGMLSVCRIVYGAEPKDAEVHARLLAEWRRLRFSAPLVSEVRPVHCNPKRRQRQVKRELAEQRGVGTKAQQAMKQAYEERQAERKELGREQKRVTEDYRFEMRQAKRKAKHRGH